MIEMINADHLPFAVATIVAQIDFAIKGKTIPKRLNEAKKNIVNIEKKKQSRGLK